MVDNKKAQKYLLIGFEKLVGEVHPHLLAKVPHILKAFYDEDILEEESILEWADKVKHFIHYSLQVYSELIQYHVRCPGDQHECL